MKYICISFIKCYQSAVARFLPPSCRHIPSCSHYAIEAIETHGAGKGLWLTIKRIMQCHPWGTHGYDPVPKEENR